MRSQARQLLAEVALDGLPKRAVVKSTPTMNDHVETCRPDLALGWKPSTAARHHNAWRLDHQSHFGDCPVVDVTRAYMTRADVQRWRDSCIGIRKPGSTAQYPCSDRSCGWGVVGWTSPTAPAWS